MSRSTPPKPQIFKHSKRVAWRKVADEAVILDVETARYYSLDGAGLAMWELLGKGKRVPEVARLLAADYDAPEAEIRADCAALVARLAKKGLIEAKSAS